MAKKPFRRRLFVGIAIMILLLNGLALSSNAFCDVYIAKVFPVWVNTYGRIIGIFPFSVGEWLLLIGILLVILAAALGLLTGAWGVLWLFGKRRANCADEGRLCASGRILTWFPYMRRFYVFFLWVVLVVGLIMTLNCSLLYHASAFSEKYFGESIEEYDLAELLRVYDLVAEECNRLSGEVARDGQGYILYSGSISETGKRIDMQDKARETMGQLGKRYSQLDGYYPRPKPMFFSDFMCQQYMLGWYFPFTMEANYNKAAYVMNQPFSMCHELAHLRGYIYEDEANFISYLACVQSDDIYFQYSGYLNVLSYLERDITNAAASNPEAFAAALEEVKPSVPDEIVYRDDIFVKPEDWERIEEKALIDTEVVDQATDAFVDTTLKVNGVSDGKISYSRVVRLLLQYYALEGLGR